jgi:hypothetical protein
VTIVVDWRCHYWVCLGSVLDKSTALNKQPKARKLHKGRRASVQILDKENIEENVLFSLRSLAGLPANQYACKGCRTVNNMTMEL